MRSTYFTAISVIAIAFIAALTLANISYAAPDGSQTSRGAFVAGNAPGGASTAADTGDRPVVQLARWRFGSHRCGSGCGYSRCESRCDSCAAPKIASCNSCGNKCGNKCGSSCGSKCGNKCGSGYGSSCGHSGRCGSGYGGYWGREEFWYGSWNYRMGNNDKNWIEMG